MLLELSLQETLPPFLSLLLEPTPSPSLMVVQANLMTSPSVLLELALQVLWLMATIAMSAQLVPIRPPLTPPCARFALQEPLALSQMPLPAPNALTTWCLAELLDLALAALRAPSVLVVTVYALLALLAKIEHQVPDPALPALPENSVAMINNCAPIAPLELSLELEPKLVNTVTPASSLPVANPPAHLALQTNTLLWEPLRALLVPLAPLPPLAPPCYWLACKMFMF